MACSTSEACPADRTRCQLSAASVHDHEQEAPQPTCVVDDLEQSQMRGCGESKTPAQASTLNARCGRSVHDVSGPEEMVDSNCDSPSRTPTEEGAGQKPLCSSTHDQHAPPQSMDKAKSTLSTDALTKPSGLQRSSTASLPLTPSTERSERDAPECAICVSWLCDPLLLPCQHAFCRMCLHQAARARTSDVICPLCRAPITTYPSLFSLGSTCSPDAVSPLEPKQDAGLEKTVCDIVSPEAYHARQALNRSKLEAMVADAHRSLPVFYMYPGVYAGRPFSLHFFEPRYRLLARRAWQTNRLFIFCSSPPHAGHRAMLVRIDTARFSSDGRANVSGHALQTVTLSEAWVEPDTCGLYFARTDDKSESVARLLATAAGTTGNATNSVAGNAADTGAGMNVRSNSGAHDPRPRSGARESDGARADSSRQLPRLMLVPRRTGMGDGCAVM